MRLLVFQQGPRRYFQRLAISLCASTALFASLTCPATSDEPAAPSKRSKPSQFAELTNPDNPIRKLFGDARLQLWSLQPITRPAVPTVRQQDWVWNPIDTFLLARWEDHKTDPLSQADHYRFRAFFAACQLDDKRPDLLLVRESVDKVEGTRVFYQGDHRQLREEVPPGFPSVLFPIPPEIPRPSHGKTTGRRTTLARWIGSEQNPWAARVLVNRLWQHHFGVGLVESPNDFGWTGSTPNNLPLLDYLACELMENGWSIKSVQRLILTSHAYRQIAVSDAMRTSAPQKAQWASPRRTLHRLRAEELRDAILSTSGLLSLEEVDKPVWPDLSQDILQTNPAILDDNKEKTKGWYPSPPSKQGVRSLYLIQKRTLRLPWMETFDQPENATSCGRRDVSIVAPQALAQLNSELAVQASERLEASCAGDLEDQEKLVVELFERVLCRAPTDSELARSLRHLEKTTVAEFANVLLNTNEYLFVP